MVHEISVAVLVDSYSKGVLNIVDLLTYTLLFAFIQDYSISLTPVQYLYRISHKGKQEETVQHFFDSNSAQISFM